MESDTLSRDEVGAIFAYLQRRPHYKLHCIIDTAGKLLHGWFDAPRNKIFETRLKAGLEAFGCDPKIGSDCRWLAIITAMQRRRLPAANHFHRFRMTKA